MVKKVTADDTARGCVEDIDHYQPVMKLEVSTDSDGHDTVVVHGRNVIYTCVYPLGQHSTMNARRDAWFLADRYHLVPEEFRAGVTTVWRSHSPIVHHYKIPGDR